MGNANDVSPWPQADRAIPTQGELAEDQNLVIGATSIGRLFSLSRLLAKTCNQRVAVRSDVAGCCQRRMLLAPTTALDYALWRFGQLQISYFPPTRIDWTQ